MNNPPLDRETMIKVYKCGTYHNPASQRYGPDANVVCDRCKKSKLDVCIGYQTYDLCLACIQEINELLKKKPITTLPECSRNPPLTRMIQSQFRPTGSTGGSMMRTNMVQNQFRSNVDTVTLMAQNQFRPNDDLKSYMQVNQFRYPVTDIRAEMKQNKFRHPYGQEEEDDDDMMSFMIQNQFRK